MRHTRLSIRPHDRRGAALVEFAILFPVFLGLILGTIEIGTGLRASNLMASGVREGGRLASMDTTGVLPQGTTLNQKVTLDIRNFLAASGLPADDITITITEAEGDAPFDLGDPANSLELFRITATIPYDSVSMWPSNFLGGENIRAALVFRAGRIKQVE